MNAYVTHHDQHKLSSHCASLYTYYHAEVRQEAVQQALAALKNRPKPSLPMPSKRSSVLNRSPDRGRDDDDDDSGVYAYHSFTLRLMRIFIPPISNIAICNSQIELSSDEESALDDRISTPDREYNNISRKDRDSSREHSGKREDQRRPPQNLPMPPKGHQQPTPSDTSSTGSPTQHNSHKYYDKTDISEFDIRSRKFLLSSLSYAVNN